MRGFILVLVILLIVSFSKSRQIAKHREFLSKTTELYDLKNFDNTLLESKRIINANRKNIKYRP